jgi:hypothetical protein
LRSSSSAFKENNRGYLFWLPNRKAPPRDVLFNWNPDKIFAKLAKKKISVFPSPSLIRAASPEERAAHQATITIEGQPSRRIEVQDLIKMYEKLHPWLHEINPYKSKRGSNISEVEINALLSLIQTIHKFIEKHLISINGKAYFAVIKDDKDGLAKVIPLDKISDL